MKIRTYREKLFIKNGKTIFDGIKYYGISTEFALSDSRYGEKGYMWTPLRIEIINSN